MWWSVGRCGVGNSDVGREEGECDERDHLSVFLMILGHSNCLLATTPTSTKASVLPGLLLDLVQLVVAPGRCCDQKAYCP